MNLQKKESMTAVVPPLDALRYLHKADPLERRVTFDDLQTRPLGFQSAMPRDPIASMTNSFEFKVREGEMFEAAKSAATTMTAEKMREATAEHVASTEGLPLELAGRGPSQVYADLERPRLQTMRSHAHCQLTTPRQLGLTGHDQ